MTLYGDLGIPKDASEAAVKQSYRSCAKATHPDRGGDRNEFQRVLLAYKVLSDPAKRAEYDRTGEVPVDVPDQTMQKIIQTVAQVFDAALGGLVNSGRNPTEHDLAHEMRDVVKKRIKQIETDRKGPEKILAVLTTLLGRFEVAEGENDMEALIANQVEGVKRTLSAMEADKEFNESVLAFLKQFKYRHDKKKDAHSIIGMPAGFTIKGTW